LKKDKDYEKFFQWLQETEAIREEQKEKLWGLAESLTEQLSRPRCRHTFSVVATCDRLAEQYGVDRTQCCWAALGHDCAKENKELAAQDYVDFMAAEIDSGVLSIPALHHAALGVVVMVRQHGMIDPAVLQAIRYHSTGCAGLSPVGQVLFCADFIEPSRNNPDRAATEEACFIDLGVGCREVLRAKLEYLLHHGRPVHPSSWSFWNELVRAEHKSGERGELETAVG
jgi:nicotinate-nucleotide adenylyltransferase